MTTTAPTAVEVDFGSRLRIAREQAGLTLTDVVVELRSVLPRPLWVSQSKLARLEKNDPTEEKADPFLIGVLAYVYNVDLADLSTIAEAALVGTLGPLMAEMLDSPGQL